MNGSEHVIRHVYPELELYLADDPLVLLAAALGCSVRAVWRQFDLAQTSDVHKFARTLRAIRRVVQGRAFRSDGYPFKRSFVARVWRGLV